MGTPSPLQWRAFVRGTQAERATTVMHSCVLTSAAHLAPAVTALLLAKGADPNYRDPTSGFSPLHQVTIERTTS